MSASEDWINHFPAYTRQGGVEGTEILLTAGSFEKPLVYNGVTATSDTMVVVDVNKVPGAPLYPSEVMAAEYCRYSGRDLDTLRSVNFPVVTEMDTEYVVRDAVKATGARSGVVVFRFGDKGWKRLKATTLVRLAARTTGRKPVEIEVDGGIFRRSGPVGDVNLTVHF